jgi:NTE family protein
VLEAFDELGVKPAAIAGTSMGAIVGAAYAAGMSGAEIRAYVLAT